MREAKDTLVEESEREKRAQKRAEVRGDQPARVNGSSQQPAAGKTQTLQPLLELTSLRVREFLREKEAVFWVFIFPVLMTFALGIAFRNTAPDKTPVAIEATTDAKANEVAQLL